MSEATVLNGLDVNVRLSDLPVLFVDCQTTGATPSTAHILEVGWAVGRASGALPELHSSLILQPDNQLPPVRIQRITGINAEAMLAARPAAEIAASLQALLRAERISAAVAHWAQFEKLFLTDFFDRYLSPDAVNLDFICTCLIAKKLYPDLPSRAIRAVGGYFGFDIEEMKRSGGHVETTFYIWQKLASQLEEMGIGTAAELGEWLKVQPKVKATKAQKLAAAAVKESADKNYLLPMERLRRLDLPDQPGVYRLLNSRGKILYVGKATSLKSRVNSYFTGRKGKASKTKELISQVFDLDVTPLATPFEAALLENDLIKEHDPPYNRALKKRDRTLLYFDRQFRSARTAPDVAHFIGPIPAGSTIEPLALIADGVAGGQIDPRLFWGLLDQEMSDRAVSLFLAEYRLAEPGQPPLTVRKLLALGLAFYRRDLLDSLAEEPTGRYQQRDFSLTCFLGPPALADLDEDEAEVAEEEEAAALAEAVITDEELLSLIRGIVAGSARVYAVTRTILRLLDVAVSFEEKKQRRRLVFADGHLQSAEEWVVAPADKSKTLVFEPRVRLVPARAMTIATYDRMKVLLAEIRRLYNRGHRLSIQ